VELEITDLSNNYITELETSDVPEVKPFTTEEFTLKFNQHGLSEGEYFAQVKVNGDDGNIFDDRVAFTVLADCRSTDEEVVEEDAGNKFSKALIFGGIAVIIGGALYFIFLSRKKDRREN
jgi:hypothetical protein